MPTKLFLIICLLAISSSAYCAEYPGKPVTEQPGAAPESVKKQFIGLRTLPDGDDLADALKSYIESYYKINDEAFPLYDEKGKKDLRLKLSEVDVESARYLKNNSYFIRASLKEEFTGDYYDVDFWMTRQAFGTLVVSGQRIQKKNGSPRYYYEGDNIVEY